MSYSHSHPSITTFYWFQKNLLLALHNNSQEATLPMPTSGKHQFFFKLKCHMYFNIYECHHHLIWYNPKAMVFPVEMYGCESWTIETAESRRIDAFELWCWRRLLRVPWTARRSNQSILKEISPNSSTLATWGKELTHLKRPWCWERLGAGGEGDDRGWEGWMASPTRWTWVGVNSRSWWWTGRPCMLQFMGSKRVGHNWATELNWTEEVMYVLLILLPCPLPTMLHSMGVWSRES